MNINRITLDFSAEIESGFKDKYFQNSLTQFRLSFILITFLYGIFGYLDKLIIAEYVHLFHLIRFGIVIPLFTLVSFFHSVNISLKYGRSFYLFVSLLVGQVLQL
ncbi:MAG: hypothetical protein ACERKD_11310 [Prolixibacteraceae bacterium]